MDVIAPPIQALKTHGESPAAAVKFVRLPVVEAITGLKKSTIYAKVKDKTFPAPYRLSARAVAWREDLIFRWCAERVTAEVQPAGGE